MYPIKTCTKLSLIYILYILIYNFFVNTNSFIFLKTILKIVFIIGVVILYYK